MLKNSKVNVRIGPGLDYPIKFIYKKKYLPVKVIDKKENFRKVIDHKKNSGWIHISQLKKVNSIIVLSDRILFKKPTFNSRPIAKIESGRLFFLEKCRKNWCQVSSQNYSGWINIDNVWGKN
ncbi:SH3 domain-containing protein [Candidatus Pelagibacter sp.]|nr:SH3 domain-containing protein [Candidatus Pelagibacter sp.]